MALVRAGDLNVHHELSGAADAPVIVLSSSLGANLSMWAAQVPVLEARFRVLRYDARGHGRTSVTPGPYTIAQLSTDVIRLLDALKLGPVDFCGLSIGGLIGMWLGVHAPERLRRLVLCNTAARIGTHEAWNARIETVSTLGMRGLAGAVVERWFTPEFRQRAPEAFAKARVMLEQTSPQGYVACCEALRDADLRGEIGAIRTPTLVIAGTHDPATPPAEGRAVADAVPGARYVELRASHLSNVEAAGPFSDELVRFLAG
jgi:3-oxoadipate enol-lactonase